LEIYDVGPYLKSRVFIANGYKVNTQEAAVEKVFTRVQPDEL
jgi:DNA replication licensing factor MCM2